MTRFALLALAAVAAAAPLLATAQRSPVTVTREEPIIERTEYDPRRPPRNMPELKPPESGVCKTTFELSASVNYSAERLTRTTARIYVDELEIVTRLHFEIFTVRDGGPEAAARTRKAHRAIGEYHYKDSRRIAEEIGKRLIGQTFDGNGADHESAQLGLRSTMSSPRSSARTWPACASRARRPTSASTTSRITGLEPDRRGRSDQARARRRCAPRVGGVEPHAGFTCRSAQPIREYLGELRLPL